MRYMLDLSEKIYDPELEVGKSSTRNLNRVEASSKVRKYKTWTGGAWKDGTWEDEVWKKGKVKKRNSFIVSLEPPIAIEEDSIIDFLLNYHSKSLQESFRFNSLTDDEKEEMYLSFKKSYEKATGASWDQFKFKNRAYNWTFFGEKTGGIAVRNQRSGLVKMVSAFGSPKKVINGYKEMVSEIGNKPIWGVMTENLAIMLEKISNKEFKRAPKIFVKTVIPHIKNIFGDIVLDVDKKTGAIVIDTPAGPMDKYFIANKNYYKDILDKAKDKSDLIPVPKPVLKVLVDILKKFI